MPDDPRAALREALQQYDIERKALYPWFPCGANLAAVVRAYLETPATPAMPDSPDKDWRER